MNDSSSNYDSPDYYVYNEWIRRARNKKHSWDSIRFCLQENEEGLKKFLDGQKIRDFWDITINEWYDLVESNRNKEENNNNKWDQGILRGPHQDNNCFVPDDPNSAWQKYRERLLNEKGFRLEAVENMEQTIEKILKRLNKDTRNTEPIKGLVVGNVQSGKTANMAGLIAMAADWGWNMFIVLSGTIESLRLQTQARIFGDLKNPECKLNWNSVEHPCKNSSCGQRAQDLNLESNNEKYLTVCLKNSKRLKDLIQWMQMDSNKVSQMRVLVIDDEADQASINTLVNKAERTAINRYITNLVNGKDIKNKKIKVPFNAMNYIGYTATPYANILNESSSKSLYPKDFIATLGLSKEYFGPQQIFGLDGGEYEGLDIVRIVSSNDLGRLKDIHDGDYFILPESIKDAICWFICGVAVMRYRKYHKPVSMLIHTSQRTKHHDNISKAIMFWFRNTEEKDLLNRIKMVWNRETIRFGIQEFCEQYPDYEQTVDIPPYPKYEDIVDIIKNLISAEPSHITLSDEGDRQYYKGIHLCIDNCKNNGDQDGMYLRLAYPEENQMPCDAPAFIVIGGQTLARGLTLEGLISTYFLRSVGQADTLMQMGRWFGYRKNYELLPRIWMTEKTQKQFKFLSALDQELRDEIIYMDKANITPDQYGPRVKNTPDYQFIRIAAKNKMNGAIVGDVDYTGSFNQTTSFDVNKSVLQSNLNHTIEFIDSLKKPDNPNELNPNSYNDAVWRNIQFDKIRNFIEKYHFQQNFHFGQNLKPYMEWIEKVTKTEDLDNWNVVVAGGGINKQDDTNVLPLKYVKVKKLCRSRELVPGTDQPDSTLIKIRVLSSPRDIVADMDPTEEDKELIDLLKDRTASNAKFIRCMNGMETIPQLIIYIIDKDSKKAPNSKNRADLNAPVDLAGLCFNIPGGRRGVKYAKTVHIQLSKDNLFDDEGDLEELDGD